MNHSAPVLCFGEILWDVLPTGNVLGGAPLNVASHLHQWGHKVYLLSAVGNDSLGKQALEKLNKAGFRGEGIYTHPSLATSTVDVTLDAHGNASYSIHEPVAWDALQLPSELESVLVPGFPLVHGTLALRSASNRTLLQSLIDRFQPKLCLDINFRPPYDSIDSLEPFIRQAHFLKMNEHELHRLTDSLAEDSTLQKRIETLARRYSCPRICVTRGALGAIYWRDGYWIEGTTPPVRVVDTIGAGDAFMASMVDALIHNSDGEPDSVLNACAAGAKIAAQRGAQNLF